MRYLHGLEFPRSFLNNVDAKRLRRFFGEEELCREGTFELVLVPIVVVLLHAAHQRDRISVNVDDLVHVKLVLF